MKVTQVIDINVTKPRHNKNPKEIQNNLLGLKYSSGLYIPKYAKTSIASAVRNIIISSKIL